MQFRYLPCFEYYLIFSPGVLHVCVLIFLPMNIAASILSYATWNVLCKNVFVRMYTWNGSMQFAYRIPYDTVASFPDFIPP